jgi:hypothetical protein
MQGAKINKRAVYLYEIKILTIRGIIGHNLREYWVTLALRVCVCVCVHARVYVNNPSNL